MVSRSIRTELGLTLGSSRPIAAAAAAVAPSASRVGRHHTRFRAQPCQSSEDDCSRPFVAAEESEASSVAALLPLMRWKFSSIRFMCTIIWRKSSRASRSTFSECSPASNSATSCRWRSTRRYCSPKSLLAASIGDSALPPSDIISDKRQTPGFVHVPMTRHIANRICGRNQMPTSSSQR